MVLVGVLECACLQESLMGWSVVCGSSGKEKGVWSLMTPSEKQTHLLLNIMGAIRVICLMMVSFGSTRGRVGLRSEGEQTIHITLDQGLLILHGSAGWVWAELVLLPVCCPPSRSVLLCVVLSAKKKINSQNICKVTWPQA